MKIISTWIAKGGVGKSTLAGNLAYYLRERGRVLLIDADPQGNTTGWLHPEAFDWELGDALAEKVSLKEAVIPIRSNLDLIGTFAIGGNLKNWAETVLPGRPFAFHDLRDELEAAGYDFIIFDMSPGASMLEKSIIAIANEVIPVVRPEYFSIDGLEVFEDTIQNIRKELRSKAETPRLVVNGINMSFSVHRAYFDSLKQFSYQIFTVGQTTKATEAQTAHKFLAEYDPANKVLGEYNRLAKAV